MCCDIYRTIWCDAGANTSQEPCPGPSLLLCCLWEGRGSAACHSFLGEPDQEVRPHADKQILGLWAGWPHRSLIPLSITGGCTWHSIGSPVGLTTGLVVIFLEPVLPTALKCAHRHIRQLHWLQTAEVRGTLISSSLKPSQASLTQGWMGASSFSAFWQLNKDRSQVLHRPEGKESTVR